MWPSQGSEPTVAGPARSPGDEAYALVVTTSGTPPPAVRRARIEDVTQMARVIVECWQETYRGLMPDAVLDDPDFPVNRRRFWHTVLTDHRFSTYRVAVAELDHKLIGVAMAGPASDPDAAWTSQLYVLYVYSALHGSPAAPKLLEAVLPDPSESVALWVADPNPRAQAFYRKHGFKPDGTIQIDDGVREIRMVRNIEPSPAAPTPNHP